MFLYLLIVILILVKSEMSEMQTVCAAINTTAAIGNGASSNVDFMLTVGECISHNVYTNTNTYTSIL